MKFSLIAAVVLLALAQGSFAQETPLNKLSQHFENVKTQVAQMLNSELATEPAIEPKIAEFQEQLKTAVASWDDTLRDMSPKFQAFLDNLGETIKKSKENLQQ